MTSNKATKRNQPRVSYQLADTDNSERLDNAFDILFEETLKQDSDLTAMNN